jgi:hypothetical protein
MVCVCVSVLVCLCICVCVCLCVCVSACVCVCVCVCICVLYVLAMIMCVCVVVDLRNKAKRALKAVGAQCTLLAALQPLLSTAPTPVLITYLTQFEKVGVCARAPGWLHAAAVVLTVRVLACQIVPMDATQRRDIVASGGLKAIQVCLYCVPPSVLLLCFRMLAASATALTVRA